MRHNWWDDKAVPLTPCLSWDETQLMRLPGKRLSSVPHILLVMGWDIIDETRNTAYSVPLTFCCSWDETWLMRNQAVLLTSCWSCQDETQLMRLEIKQCHSQPVMGWNIVDEIKAIEQCHLLWVPVGQGMRHNWLHKTGNRAVSLTFCWSWDETWLMRLEIKQCHSLPVGHGVSHN